MLHLEGLSKPEYSQYDALFSSKLLFANYTRRCMACSNEANLHQQQPGGDPFWPEVALATSEHHRAHGGHDQVLRKADHAHSTSKLPIATAKPPALLDRQGQTDRSPARRQLAETCWAREAEGPAQGRLDLCANQR